MKPIGICAQCEQQVEWQQVSGVGGLVWTCCNCWHTIDGPELKRVQETAKELVELEERRREIIRGVKHAPAAKNR